MDEREKATSRVDSGYAWARVYPTHHHTLTRVTYFLPPPPLALTLAVRYHGWLAFINCLSLRVRWYVFVNTCVSTIIYWGKFQQTPAG